MLRMLSLWSSRKTTSLLTMKRESVVAVVGIAPRIWDLGEGGQLGFRDAPL